MLKLLVGCQILVKSVELVPVKLQIPQEKSWGFCLMCYIPASVRKPVSAYHPNDDTTHEYYYFSSFGASGSSIQ
jgi:hypothetical protein